MDCLKEERNKCEECGKSFHKNWRLQEHIRSHTGERPHKCEYEGCGKLFIRPYHLKRHMLSHTGTFSFKCSYPGCEKSFIEKHSLNRHERRSHDNPFKCDFENCSQSFKKSSQLRRHVYSHTNEKPYRCEAEGCEMGFLTKSKLASHMKKHTKGYLCSRPGCTEAFETFSKLRVHLRSHGFVCEHCNKSFALVWDLKKHVRIHSPNRKTYECPREGCSKVYTMRNNLRAHIKSFHDGQKPCVCTVEGCGMGFSSKGPLMRHMERHAQGTLYPKEKPGKEQKPPKKKKKVVSLAKEISGYHSSLSESSDTFSLGSMPRKRKASCDLQISDSESVKVRAVQRAAGSDSEAERISNATFCEPAIQISTGENSVATVSSLDVGVSVSPEGRKNPEKNVEGFLGDDVSVSSDENSGAVDWGESAVSLHSWSKPERIRTNLKKTERIRTDPNETEPIRTNSNETEPIRTKPIESFLEEMGEGAANDHDLDQDFLPSPVNGEVGNETANPFNSTSTETVTSVTHTSRSTTEFALRIESYPKDGEKSTLLYAASGCSSSSTVTSNSRLQKPEDAMNSLKPRNTPKKKTSSTPLRGANGRSTVQGIGDNIFERMSSLLPNEEASSVKVSSSKEDCVKESTAGSGDFPGVDDLLHVIVEEEEDLEENQCEASFQGDDVNLAALSGESPGDESPHEANCSEGRPAMDNVPCVDETRSSCDERESAPSVEDAQCKGDANKVDELRSNNVLLVDGKNKEKKSPHSHDASRDLACGKASKTALSSRDLARDKSIRMEECSEMVSPQSHDATCDKNSHKSVTPRDLARNKARKMALSSRDLARDKSESSDCLTRDVSSHREGSSGNKARDMISPRVENVSLQSNDSVPKSSSGSTLSSLKRKSRAPSKRSVPNTSSPGLDNRSNNNKKKNSAKQKGAKKSSTLSKSDGKIELHETQDSDVSKAKFRQRASSLMPCDLQALELLWNFKGK